jgi:hypothetical protein
VGPPVPPFLYRVDPRAAEVVARIPLDLRLKGRPAKSVDGVAVVSGAVWVALNYGGIRGEIVRIDPRTNKVVARVGARGRAGEIAATADAVWFLSDRTVEASKGVSLHRIDPATNAVVATPVRRGLEDVGGNAVLPRFVIGPHTLWTREFRNRRYVAVRVDTRTNRVTRREVAQRFDPVAVSDGLVWSLRPHRLVGLNEASLSLAASVGLDVSTTSVAFDRADNTLWAASQVTRRGERPKLVRVDLP